MFFVAFSGGACCFVQRIGGGSEILEDLGSRGFVFFLQVRKSLGCRRLM